jgi:ABC-type sugar transport system substrate-binding protein
MATIKGRTAPSRRRPGIALLVAIAAMLLIVAGCGGDEDGGSAGGGGSSSADVDAAQQIAAAASTRPAQITQTKPIDKPIPTGKDITFISCGVEACAVQGPILSEAAKTLGWSVKQVGTDGSPEKVQNAFEAAIRDGADAVIINAADANQLARPLAAAKKAGVEFVTCCSLAQQGRDVLFNTGKPSQNYKIGEYLAAKVIADSGGKANVVYVNVSAFNILAAVGKTFGEKYAQLCPSCTTDTIDIPLTSLGKDAPERIVSYLRSHPDVNYIVLSESGSLGPGLLPALQAAGLKDKVKIVGQGGNEQVYQDVRNGDILAVTPSSLFGYDYAMLDALARKWAGVPVEETDPEYWLMTKDNIPASTSGPTFPIVEDYKSQWAELWGKPV